MFQFDPGIPGNSPLPAAAASQLVQHAGGVMADAITITDIHDRYKPAPDEAPYTDLELLAKAVGCYQI